MRVLLMLCWVWSVQAADRYTLSGAFHDALARDARVQVAASRIAEQQERLVEARSTARPTLSADGTLGYDYNRNEARFRSVYEGRSTRGSLRLSQELVPGRASARLRRAEAELAAAQHSAAAIRQQVWAEVARNFAGQVFQQRILESRRDFEGLLDELARTAQERVARGTLDRTELHVIRFRLHQARAERIEAGSHYRVARLRLVRLTGMQANALQDSSLALLEAAVPDDLEAALAQAERDAPQLLRMHSLLEAAESVLALHRADRLPELSLDARISHGHTDDIRTLQYSSGVNLSMPLYDGGLKRSRLRGAALAVETARRELFAAQEQLALEVRTRWELLTGLTRALQEMQASRADSDRVVELTRSKLDLGRATLVQQLEVRQTALEAEFLWLDQSLRLLLARIELLHSLAALGPAP